MRKKNQKRRDVYTAIGFVSLALAIIGVILPIIPGIPFAILAAFFLTRGNRAVYFWLMQFKSVRKPVHDWQRYRVIRPKTKVAFIVMAIASFSTFFIFDGGLVVKIITSASLVAATIWAMFQKSKATPRKKTRKADVIEISQIRKTIHSKKSAK